MSPPRQFIRKSILIATRQPLVHLHFNPAPPLELISNSLAVIRCPRSAITPHASTTAATASAFAIPICFATAPHKVAPMAIPPCNTSRYIDNARARKCAGHIVCAATFKHARIPIHATPATNMTAHSKAKRLRAPRRKRHRPQIP